MSKYEINQETGNLTVHVDKDMILRFVDLIGDRNPIHTNREIAEAHGFEDTPIPGTLLHAYFEQLALATSFDTSSYSLKFKEPVYPDTNIIFRKKSVEAGELELECLNNDGRVVSSCKSKLSSLSGDDEEGIFIGSYDHEISEKRRDLFYSFLGMDSNERIPISLVSSSISSSLLKFLFERTGNYEGVYRGIDFNLYSPPKLGDLKTYLHVKGKKSIGDNFVYNIEGECFQDGKRVLSASVKVITNLDFKGL